MGQYTGPMRTFICALVMAIVGRISTVICQRKVPVKSHWLRRTIFSLHCVLENPGGQVSPWVHGYNFAWIAPLWEGTNLSCRLGVGKIGPIRDQRQFCKFKVVLPSLTYDPCLTLYWQQPGRSK